ncbi:hypothetical protein [Hyalangium rubrum]|uniref:Uncharacterized protein n=1 Tax=Hyalangium rubrum TaxID=3103134 RepID=A0ABU5H8G8_9BACT|nr:hypothetical protein [Hyalangium sp. s54d21]MDY7229773.1 hypothetical protein [Hyalangium sp. s54d21]
MAKDSDDRLRDTLNYLEQLLGREARTHIEGRMPAIGTVPADQLSAQISVGGDRGWFHNPTETSRRRALRATALAAIVLNNVNAVTVQNLLANAAVRGTIDGALQGRWRAYDGTVDIDTLRPRLAQLRDYSLNFLRACPVLPCDGLLRQPHHVDYGLVTVDGAGVDPMVSPMVLTPSGMPFYAFKLTYAPVTKRAQGLNMYFLPWRSARITGMTLPAAGGPNLFFTAGINGCSVFVEGPTNNPIVYHAGITPPWPDMDAALPGAVRFARLRDDAAAVWRYLFFLRSQFTRRASDNFGEVNKAHYIADGTLDPQGAKTTRRVDQFRQQITAAWALPPHNLVVTSCAAWGSVFGVRSGLGHWSFYLQENATINFTDAHGVRYATSRLLRLSKFYPRLPAYEHLPIHRAQVPDLRDLGDSVIRIG